MKKVGCIVVLAMLLITALALASNIQQAKAIGTIYIRADGSVDPPTAPIQRNGDIYTLTGNITSDADGIVIERNNMTLDGAGYTIQGTGIMTGIDLKSRSNVTIKNTEIISFDPGIWLENSPNNDISANNITNNNYYGIYLTSSSYNNISGNNITNNNNGISVESSSNNRLNHNNFIDNIQQVYFYNSGYANFWDGGYPSGGNYWSDYAGIDACHGPSQNIAGSDGIGDTPYTIDANNIDHYPLMNPYSPSSSLEVSISPVSTSIQSGQSVTFTPTIIGGTPPYSYQWWLNGSPVSGAVSSSWTFTPTSTGTDNVYLIVTDSQSNTAQSNTASVTVASPLTVSISPISTSISVGQSVTFTSSVSGGYTPYSYQWYLNNNPVSGATLSSWTFTPTSTGTDNVYLIVTDKLQNTKQSNTAQVTVQIAPPVKYTIILYTDPSNIGSITFSGTQYTNGQSGQYTTGTYSVVANVPSGWGFDHWVTTGGVSISSFATVTGDGTVTAVFKKTVSPPSVGGEWSPITMQTLTSTNTHQMLALWIGVISLMAVLATSFVYIRRKRRQS